MRKEALEMPVSEFFKRIKHMLSRPQFPEPSIIKCSNSFKKITRNRH